MRSLFRAGVAFLVALPLIFSQTTTPLTVTPTLVSVALGQPLYCAARWSKPNIQVYCFTSSAGHTWDQLVYNSIFPGTNTITVPYVLNCLPGSTTCPTSAGILWVFSPDKTTAGVVDWQVSWNGTGNGNGTFQ